MSRAERAAPASPHLMPLTQEKVKRLLNYDVSTGRFTWRVSKAVRSPAGSAAGGKTAEGYIAISIDNRTYKAHKIAWLWMLGEWPNGDIDHRNTIRHDNCWENLRAGSRSFNMQNLRRAYRNNGTGLLGVSAEKSGYRARIKIDGRSRNLGVHSTAEAAHAAYLAAKRQLHPGGTL